MLETRQTNRLQMMLSVQNYLNNQQMIWSAIPIINTFKSELDALVQTVKEQLRAAGTNTTGMTASKNQLKEQIAQKTAVLSGALAAYAAVNNKGEVLTNGYLTKSHVAGMRDVNLPEELTAFIALVRSELEGLADYGVMESQLTDLESSVDDFREQVGLPRLKRSEGNAAKREASNLVDEGISLLNDKLDRVMLQFKYSNASFYQGYESARVIVD